jgi:hypothetical protein
MTSKENLNLQQARSKYSAKEIPVRRIVEMQRTSRENLNLQRARGKYSPQRMPVRKIMRCGEPESESAAGQG